MAELDQVYICNPTDEHFEQRYNGEVYSLKVHEETTLPYHLARHLAKHLSDRMMREEFRKIEQDFLKKHKTLTPTQVDQQLGTKKTMMTMQDIPERRIALYKVLQSKKEVLEVIKAYPQFKAEVSKGETKFGFIGEISIYDDFVDKFEQKDTPQEEPVKEPTPKEKPEE